ncbi:MAG TPA: tetratricopeptide repeat protein [Candidatus Aminicenantes bacterium]|nr:tetratricopeptide repeat protein [Candidatus Aminicenantes bacterium]
MKRVDRKQLKGDEFVSGLNKIYRFARAREKELLILAGVLAVVVLALAGLSLIRNQSEKKESRQISEILKLRAEADQKPENLGKLEKMAGNGKFSRVAYLELAAHWVENGDPAKAETYVRKIKGSPRDVFYYRAQDLLAQILILRKDYDGALRILDRIESEKPKSYPLDAVLFHKAEAYEKQGKRMEALAAYKRVQQDFAQTYYGYEASLKASQLEGAK